MIEHRYGVAGMTCGHCASFVTEEIERIEGVTAVNVDLTNNKVTITSDRELTLAEVHTAIDEAGYELTGQEH